MDIMCVDKNDKLKNNSINHVVTMKRHAFNSFVVISHSNVFNLFDSILFVIHIFLLHDLLGNIG